MGSTAYTVNILMNMRDTISRAAESAARAMGLLDDSTNDASEALEKFADLNKDIEQSLEDLGASTAEAVDGVGDLADASADAGSGIDAMADPVATATSEIKDMFAVAYDTVDGLEDTAVAAQDAGVELQGTGTEAEKAAEGLKKTGEGAKTAKKEISELEQAVKTAAIAMAVIKLAQEGLEFVKQGALVQEIRDRYIAFSGSATAAAQNLEIFRAATRGTVPDTEAMLAISKLMGMGLVDNAAQMGEVAKMAVGLGDPMKEAGDRVMDFAQLLATGSTRRLYEYGINIANVETRIKELQKTQQGLSKDDAFKLAVMAEGRIQLEKLGTAGMSADDKLDFLAATVANLKDSLAVMASKLLETSGILDWLMERLPKLPDTISQINTLSKIFASIPLVSAMGKFALAINPVILSLRAVRDILEWVIKAGATVITWIGRWAATNDTLRLAMYKALPAEMQTNEELSKLAGVATAATEKTDGLTESIDKIPAKKAVVIETTELVVKPAGGATTRTVTTTIGDETTTTTIANLERVGVAAGTATAQVNALTTAVVAAPPKMAAATTEIATSANSVRVAGDAYQYYRNTMEKTVPDVLAVERATGFLKRSQDDLVLSITVELKKALAAGTINQDEYNKALGQAKLRSDYLTTGNGLLYSSLVTNTNAYVTGKSTILEYITSLGIYSDRAVASAIAKTDAFNASIGRIPAEKSVVLRIIEKVTATGKRLLGLQEGGIASGLVKVGERGTELVQLPVGSRVYSHEQSTTINQTFNQTVNTRASSGTVAMDFQMLRSLAT